MGAMRIDGTGRPLKLNSRADARRGEGAGARFEVGGEATSTQMASGTARAEPATGIEALLALQAVEDPLFAKRKAVRRGQTMLDLLEEMKADLLAGRISEGRLNQLVALITQAKVASDPGLDSLVEDIELRVRVELAKLGRYPACPPPRRS